MNVTLMLRLSQDYIVCAERAIERKDDAAAQRFLRKAIDYQNRALAYQTQGSVQRLAKHA